MINTEYDKAAKVWVAFYTDSVGRLGECQFGMTKEVAAFKLGVEYGRNPHKFARPIGEYMAEYEKELKELSA